MVHPTTKPTFDGDSGPVNTKNVKSFGNIMFPCLLTMDTAYVLGNNKPFKHLVLYFCVSIFGLYPSHKNAIHGDIHTSWAVFEICTLVSTICLVAPCSGKPFRTDTCPVPVTSTIILTIALFVTIYPIFPWSATLKMKIGTKLMIEKHNYLGFLNITSTSMTVPVSHAPISNQHEVNTNL